jgi:hypothetical protein
VAIDAQYADTYNPLSQDPEYNPSAVTSGTLKQQSAQQNTAPASGGFFSGLGALPGEFGTIESALGGAPASAPAAGASSPAGWGSFWGFVGNPARIGTVAVGGLMIAAGIFALSRGSGVTIVMPAGGKGSTESGRTGVSNQTHHVRF